MISLPTFPSSEKWWAMVKALSGMWTRHFTLEVAVIVDTQLDQLPVLETSSEISSLIRKRPHQGCKYAETCPADTCILLPT